MLSVKNDDVETHPCAPQHVAIIMDGNGRWAKNRGKSRVAGHKEGMKAVRRAVKFAVDNNIRVLTLYAFSSENWSRPRQEIIALMGLFIWVLDSEIKNLQKNCVRLRVIGDTRRLNWRIQERIRAAEKLTQANNGLILNVAANYGGRWDIINGVKKLARQIAQDALQPEQINETLLSEQLCLHDTPTVDLVIRTGGEYRISNFLLWQIAYAELYFTDVLWPDFDEQLFANAINAFSARERRYGGT